MLMAIIGGLLIALSFEELRDLNGAWGGQRVNFSAGIFFIPFAGFFTLLLAAFGLRTRVLNLPVSRTLNTALIYTGVVAIVALASAPFLGEFVIERLASAGYRSCKAAPYVGRLRWVEWVRPGVTCAHSE